MSFRLGSFIQAVAEQTYLDAEVNASVVPDELSLSKGLRPKRSRCAGRRRRFRLLV